jgi:hypothetical protein
MYESHMAATQLAFDLQPFAIGLLAISLAIPCPELANAMPGPRSWGHVRPWPDYCPAINELIINGVTKVIVFVNSARPILRLIPIRLRGKVASEIFIHVNHIHLLFEVTVMCVSHITAACQVLCIRRSIIIQERVNLGA